MPVDFGRSARDYAVHRGDFPPELFARLRAMAVGLPGQRVVDLATGTGTLARAFARAGCAVTGIDPAAALMDEGRRLDVEAGVGVTYRVARAEQTGLPESSWDVVSAGQCWPWFDGPRVAREARRLLVGGGALVICNRDPLPVHGGVCAASEELVVRYNPNWQRPPVTAIYPQYAADPATAGFGAIETFSFDVTMSYSHEAWRGRMRTCNGVGPTLPEATVAEFDAALAQLLAERFPEDPLAIPHRIWAVTARAPADR